MELAVGIGLLTVLATVFVGGGIFVSQFSKAVEAGNALKVVRKAQIEFLADNPSLSVADITGSNYTKFLTYLPNGTLPILPSYDGQVPTINVAVFPPIAVGASGPITYGKPDDGLWDAGK